MSVNIRRAAMWLGRPAPRVAIVAISFLVGCLLAAGILVADSIVDDADKQRDANSAAIKRLESLERPSVKQDRENARRSIRRLTRREVRQLIARLLRDATPVQLRKARDTGLLPIPPPRVPGSSGGDGAPAPRPPSSRPQAQPPQERPQAPQQPSRPPARPPQGPQLPIQPQPQPLLPELPCLPLIGCLPL